MKDVKICWLPRVLAILYILFISLFALDALSGQAPVFEKIAGFSIHLIPSFLLAAVLIYSWKYPLQGGVIFIFFSVLFTLYFKTYNQLEIFLLISLPPVVIGALFVILNLTHQDNPYN